MARSVLSLAVAAAILAMGSGAARAEDAPVRLDVHFRLTDLNYEPLPGQAVRLVFGPGAGRQSPASGHAFVTDSNGDIRFPATVVLDKQLRRLPTNFVDSLLSRPKLADHLTVAAELDYMSYRWLYAMDLFRFADGGDVSLDGFSIFTRDAQGRFTNKAVQTRGGWRMTDLRGLMLTTPGHEVWNFALEPTREPDRWTLRLAFKKYPPPVRR